MASSDSAPQQGQATQLILEVLGSVLSPERALQVLEAAGWDAENDEPTDPMMSTTDLIVGDLYVRLIEVLGPDAAGEVRESLCRLIPRVRKEASHRSGVRAKRLPAATLVPRGADAMLVVSTDPDLAAALTNRVGAANILVTTDSKAIADELTEAGAELVVLDRRFFVTTSDLAALVPDLFVDRIVVLWGSRTIHGPEVERLLCECARRIDCAADTQADDVACLCATILQPNGTRKIA